MIVATASLLGYDLYDLQLAAVKDNTELRKLLIETSRKSIVVIEDIDCSLDLTGQRRKKKEKGGNNNEKDPRQKLEKEERETRSSQFVNCCPADVVEHLMPKTVPPDVEFSLRSLIQALEETKEEAKLQAEKEAEE
ncbi:hypothetical protein Patl1_22076 [Pistacia atlantica]|uniref:Uncharacterized protein n=1 Tax=Pistacia atlantica TaxID=434234 RepID=A0ACC1BMQ2_9ROSI|nr:hypothetical protein Patl1_22076 [Pistacia atlantica]